MFLLLFTIYAIIKALKTGNVVLTFLSTRSFVFLTQLAYKNIKEK